MADSCPLSDETPSYCAKAARGDKQVGKVALVWCLIGYMPVLRKENQDVKMESGQAKMLGLCGGGGGGREDVRLTSQILWTRIPGR